MKNEFHLKDMLLIMIIGLFITGCITWGNGSDQNGTEQNIEEISGSISDSANKIKKETKSIRSKIPSKVDAETDKIDREADSIKSQAEKLTKAQSDIKSLKKEIRELRSENEKLESEKNEALQKALIWLILFGIVAVAAAAMMLVNGNTKAIGLGVGAIVLIFCSLGISFFMKGFAIAGSVGMFVALAAICYMVYAQISQKKESSKKDKVNKELVHTVEMVKELIPAKGKVEIFGDKSIPGKVSLVQSSDTEEIVASYRRQLKDKIEPTIKK